MSAGKVIVLCVIWASCGVAAVIMKDTTPFFLAAVGTIIAVFL